MGNTEKNQAVCEKIRINPDTYPQVINNMWISVLIHPGKWGKILLTKESVFYIIHM
jgi:hypothetical protein